MLTSYPTRIAVLPALSFEGSERSESKESLFACDEAWPAGAGIRIPLALPARRGGSLEGRSCS